MMNSCNEITVIETVEFLKTHDDYVIVTHSSPDGDTLGSAFALKGILGSIGKKAEVINGDGLPAKFSYLGEIAEITDTENKTVVAVDVADTKLVGGSAKPFIEKTELCIDHHGSNTHYAENLLLNAKASACCEIIAEIGNALCVTFDKKTAEALYTGVATDTGCFVFSNVTPATHSLAAKLMERGADVGYINRFLFDTKSKGRLFLESVALKNLKFAFEGKCAYTVIEYEDIYSEESDPAELDAIAAIPRTIEGVNVGFTLKGREKGKYKVSVRTYAPIDASAICGAFGGGGHARAAGCEIEGDSESVINRILDKVKEQI